MIEPRPVEELRGLLQDAELHSFWGHDNTRAAATALLGRDVRPKEARPAVSLRADGYPMLGDATFGECWVMSPEYPVGFRPAIGEEVPAEKILGWQTLRIRWEE